MRSARYGGSLILFVLAGLVASTASAQPPSATKVFDPDVIGPGSATTILITISNPDPVVPATDLAVSDTLPAGMTIAATPFASTTCADASLSAPAGGNTFSLSGGRLGAGQSCTVSVDVTVATPGAFVNTTSDVTSSAGNGGSATDTLTGDAGRAGFSLLFSPSTVPLGGTSTLVYTIDASFAAGFSNVSFSNDLPEGLVVADPPNASSDCDAFGPPTIDAEPGTRVISVNGIIDPPDICTVEVDVTARSAGVFENRTSVLLVGFESTGFASGVLTATTDTLNLGAFFSGDPVAPGNSLDLEFTISNFSRDGTATDISFTDDLDDALSGLVAVGLPLSNPCGAGSSLSGTDVLTFSGGTLASGQSCTFSVPVAVPAGAAPGRYTHTTSRITADIGGESIEGDAVSDFFDVAFVPTLEKSFETNLVGAGQSTNLDFTITNTSATLGATDIEFTDNLSQFIPGLVALDLPVAGVCGPGSSLSLVPLAIDELALSLTGGNLPAGGSCDFSVTLEVPIGAPGGSFTNRTSRVTATVGDEVSGHPATAELSVVPAPELRKAFSVERAAPGGEVDLEFTLLHVGEDLPGVMTDIAFTDDLDAMLSGLVATGLPMSHICGSGSGLSGTSELSFTGGTLERDTECTFSVTLQIPSDPTPAVYTNTTSNVTGTSAGLSVTGNAAEASLEVSNVGLTKAFTDDPVVPGTTVTLEFTITNDDPTLGASDMFFTDNLGSVVSGLSAVGLPQDDVCGAGSSLSGTSFLIFTGGNLAPDSECTFSVSLEVPTEALAGEHANITSNLSATIDDSNVVLSPATDTLEIIDALSFTKAFDQEVAAPGSTIELEFTIENAHPTLPAEGLTFTDDLEAVLSGLEAVGLPANDVCGSGSVLSGTDTLTLTGGTVPAADACTFSVTLQIPDDVALGSTLQNETSPLSGTIDDVGVTAPAAIDEFTVNLASLSKVFDAAAPQGGMTTLSFTIENLNATEALTNLRFADDLDAVLSGLVAIDTPIGDVCGTGSALTGDSSLNLGDGTLAAGASCTFTVTVEAPSSATPGDYDNITTDLTSNGISVAGPASATLTVTAAPMPDGGMDGGVGPGGGGGCGCRMTDASATLPGWIAVLGLTWALIQRRRVR